MVSCDRYRRMGMDIVGLWFWSSGSVVIVFGAMDVLVVKLVFCNGFAGSVIRWTVGALWDSRIELDGLRGLFIIFWDRFCHFGFVGLCIVLRGFVIVVFVVVAVLVIMLRACRRFGGCVSGWIFRVVWGSGGSLGIPINLVLEWVGVFVPCDVSR